MKISNNWLKKFISTNLRPEQIGELLTDLGLEVETINPLNAHDLSFDGIVVGQVLECTPIQKSEKLILTKVDIGNSEILDIVCGAPNIQANINVPVALVQSKILSPKGELLEIKERTIQNIKSQAVICSSVELGLDENHPGILILDDQLEVGSKFQPTDSSESDVVYEIGLTPNRADAMSHFGVARDLMAVLTAKSIKHQYLKPIEPNIESIQPDKVIPLQIIDSQKCPKYFGITISGITVMDSPSWLQNLLKAIGINPKNNIVDATNYILHHLGQPLHAFDADKIDQQIIVQTCPQGTSFKTLDGLVRTLDSDDLMICDQSKPLCIAGVLGGEYSGVTQQTTSVFIESAYFDPVSIRKTAKRHGLNTDASFRFERGVDPEIGKLALKQVVALILKLASGYVSSEIQYHETHLATPLQINLNLNKMKDLVGHHIPDTTVENILYSLDFKIINQQTNIWKIQVPTYRVDVTREIDVVEEVFRVFGINKVEPTPVEKIGPILPYESISTHKINQTVSEFLCHHGFYEIITNSLVSKSQIEVNDQAVEILNSIGEEYSFLKQSPWQNMLHAIQYNYNRGNKDLKLFEFGNIYGIDDNKPKESKRLSLAITGNALNKTWILKNTPSLFFYIKGILNDLLNRIAIPIETKVNHVPQHYHPKIDIQTKNKNIGIFGLIHPLEFNTPIAYAELDWNTISKVAYQNETKFQLIPKYPHSTRDFSLLVNKSISYQSIENLAFKTADDTLQKVELFDVYEGKNIPDNKISYGVSFVFQDSNRTLKDEEVDENMTNLQKAFEQKLGVILR